MRRIRGWRVVVRVGVKDGRLDATDGDNFSCSARNGDFEVDVIPTNNPVGT